MSVGDFTIRVDRFGQVQVVPVLLYHYRPPTEPDSEGVYAITSLPAAADGART